MERRLEQSASSSLIGKAVWLIMRESSYPGPYRVTMHRQLTYPDRCLTGESMNNPNELGPKAELRDYLAAERTLLAWVRTGLAMMGFGFVVARFGLFLQEFQAIAHHTNAHYGPSLWFGVALIAAGVVMTLFAGWHHVRLIRALDRGEPSTHSSMQAVAIALLLALLGLAMAIYLITVRGSAVS